MRHGKPDLKLHRSLLLIAGLGVFLCSPAVRAATCPFVATLDTLPSSCTLGPGDIVTLSNFTSTLPGSTVLSVALNGGSDPGSVGMTFNPSSGYGSSIPYMVSYVATCSAVCQIVGGSDSATQNPADGGTYNYSIGVISSGSTGANFTTSFSGVESITNSGNFLGGGINQTITLDTNFAPGSATPEPATLVLFGSGFLVLGWVARRRRMA